MTKMSDQDITAKPAHTGGQDSHFRTDHLTKDLGRRTARGGAVTVSTQVFKFLLSMSSTVVLARLLTPEDYGLVGMVAVVTGFVLLFKDLGLSAATVQRSEISNAQISTLFWVNVIVGFVVMVITAAIAPLVAWFYGEQRLLGITLGLSIGFVFGGLTVQHEALLRRQMRFSLLATAEILSLAVALLTAIILAWNSWGYWALVGSQLTQGVLYAVLIWLFCRWKPSWPVRNAGVRSMIAFGRNVTAFGILNYFARNLDNLLIGRVWGSQQLGLYARAYQLLLLPIDQINGPITAVAVPALSRLAHDPDRYRGAYLRLLDKIAMLTMPLMAFMIVTSDWIVALLLGPKWVGVGRIFSLLGISGLVQPVCNTTGWLFVSQDRSRHLFQWGMIGPTIIILSIVIGLPWGAFGVAASYSITFLVVVAPLLFWFVGRKGPVRAMDIYRTIAPSACAAFFVGIALLLFRQATSGSWLWGKLLISSMIAAGTTLIVLSLLPSSRKSLLDVKSSIHLISRRDEARNAV
jgi:O-antigen/teichoic acid export membrane protein